MDKVSIIIPAYNEEKTIRKLVEKVKEVDFRIDKEIIVVDDGSTDNTFEILNEIKGIKVIKHKKNSGKGNAIRSGLKVATGSIIAIQDADLELNPKDLVKLVKLVESNKADVVYGSRLVYGKHEDFSPFFYAGGRLVSLITNILYGTKLTDVPCGYKVFRAEIIKNIDLKCKRFEFCPEVTAKIAKKGIKIAELPVHYQPRKEGKKLRYKDGIEAIWTLIKNRLP